MKQSFTSKSHGFTIVESIVSLAIIGILAAAVITTVLGKTQAVEASLSTNNFENSGLYVAGGSIQTTAADQSIADIANSTGNEDIQAEAEAASRHMELRIIQTAVDMMMLNQALQSVNRTPGTSDMAAFPAGRPLYPGYVREPTARYQYSCGSNGEVTQIEE